MAVVQDVVVKTSITAVFFTVDNEIKNVRSFKKIRDELISAIEIYDRKHNAE